MPEQGLESYVDVSPHKSVVLVYQSDSQFGGKVLLGRLRDERDHVIEVRLAP